MGLFSEIFSWWGGNTWGTRLTIWRQGRLVGKDEFGNRYYEQKKGVGPLGAPAPLGHLHQLRRGLEGARRDGTAGCTTRSIRRRPSRTIGHGHGSGRT